MGIAGFDENLKIPGVRAIRSCVIQAEFSSVDRHVQVGANGGVHCPSKGRLSLSERGPNSMDLENVSGATRR